MRAPWLVLLGVSLLLSTVSYLACQSSDASPKIIVDSVVAVDYGVLDAKVKSLNTYPCRDARRPDQPVTTARLTNGKLKSIRAMRATRLPQLLTAEGIRDLINKVWTGNFQNASCSIDWAEATFWSVESVLEFEDGKTGLLITDGSHVALQDHDGNVWFFRMLPAAQ